MQTPEDRFYNPARINAWFAVSAILVLAASAAAILADHYDRDWKRYQEAFHEMERRKAGETLGLRAAAAESFPEGARRIANRLLRGDGEAAEGPSTLEGAAFDAALSEVRREPDFPAGAILAARALEEEAAALRTPEAAERRAALEAARDAAEDGRYRAEKEQRQLQATVDELKFRMDHARAQGHAGEAAVAEREWAEAFAREKEVHARMDALALEKSRRIDDLRALAAPEASRLERARRLDEQAGVAGAERKIESFVAKGLRDAPLLNMFAPVTKIEQAVFPDLTVDYNFAQIGRVDRCMTCHTGIDKVKVDPRTGAVTPLYTAENTPERVFRTHPRPELFVSSVSKHSLGKMGCTVCHDGLGWGLTFNDAYHTPSTPAQEKEWEEKYHWHRGESWGFPMLPQKYVEASCFKCHKDQAQLNPEDKFAKEITGAPLWNRGMRLVERHGCFGCHKIDGYAVPGLDRWLAEIRNEDRRGYAQAISIRKTGPGLGRVAAKWESKEDAWKWIWHPQALRPTTNMPRFFGQPNNRGADPLTGVDYDLRTRTEVWGMVEYLWSESEEWRPAPPPVKGDAERGRELFGGAATVGCVSCHATRDFPNPQEGGAPNDFGPELSTVGSKVSEAWLYDWVKDPSHYWAGTRMPSLRLSDQEAADVAAYLSSLRNPEWEKDSPVPVSEAAVRDLAIEAARATAKPGENPVAVVEAASFGERLRMVGRRAITRYSCFGCHDIRGFENAERIGTELGGGEGWGSKDVDRLDFGLMEDPKSVATFSDWNTGLIAERPGGGRALPHRKPEWAWLKLKNPRVYDAGITKQPHEKLLMPNFHFSDEEADSVVCFLLSLQRGEVPASKRRLRDSREILAEKMKWVVRQYNCYGCHTITREERVAPDGRHIPYAKGGDIRPWLGENRDNWPPSLGGEGAVGEGARVQPAWLFRFLRDPGSTVLRFWIPVRMPTFAFSQQELNAVVQGFAAHDAVPFPFEFQQARTLTGEERDEAAALFQELECAKCHPTRGGAQEGPRPSGLAPDLTYAHDRLRYEWVRLWLDNPAAILPGTRMPPFWRPGDDLASPPGLSRTYFGNDPHAQIRRIADYLFGIGAPKDEAAREGK